MKNRTFIVALLCGLAGLCSCGKTGIDIDVTDPQEVQWVEDIVDDDLMQAFGEEDIHFGHTPPNLDGISFILEGLVYDSLIRYRRVINPLTGVTTIEPSYSSGGGYENATYKHHFYDQVGTIAYQRFYRKAHNQPETEPSTIHPTYVIGSGNDFSAYYRIKTISPEEADPIWAYLVSATIVDDPATGNRYITNYKLGKKIIETDGDPVAGYYPGTIMIMRPLDTQPIPCVEWDTNP